MSKNLLKLTVGGLIIFVHTLCLLGIFWWKSEYLVWPDNLDVAMTIAPVTAAYVTAVVSSAIRHQNDFSAGPRANGNYVFVLVSISLLFSLALIFVTFSYRSGGAENINQLKQALLVVETAFGSAFGLFAEDLFGAAH